jgi:hypothetical protein
MVKKLKGLPLSFPSLLRSSTPIEVAARVRARRDADDCVDELFALFTTIDLDGDARLPGLAAQTLVALGFEVDVLFAMLELYDEYAEDDDEDTLLWLGMTKHAVDAVLTAQSLPTLFDELELCTAEDGTLDDAGGYIVESIVALAQRGVREERGWQGLEQLRRSDPVLWAALVPDYGDARYPACVYDCLDGVDDTFDDEMRELVVECVEPLKEIDAARPRDLALLARAVELHRAKQERAQR